MTQIIEFELQSEKRGREKERKFQEMIERRQNEEKSMRSFKAQSIISSEKGSERKLKVKEPTKTVEVRFASVSRLEKRKVFNDMLEEKEKRLAEERRQKEEAQKREEEEEIKRIRAESQFKARPIQHFKQTEVKVEKKELTNPVAPQFLTEKRAETKKLA